MITYYAKKTIEIFQEDGSVELSKTSTRFVISTILGLLDPHYIRRFKFFTWMNDIQNRIKYDAPPNPFRTISVDSNEVKYRVRKANLSAKKKGLGRVKDGNWDRKIHWEPLDEHPLVGSFRETFVESDSWEDTPYYNWQADRFKNNRKWKEYGFKSLDSFLDEHYKRYRELYRKINKEGYKSNHTGNRLEPGNRNQPDADDRLEIQVVLDRKGKIHLFDGHHRFAIAKFLDLTIPAHIVCRHKKWQEFRDEIHEKGLPKGRENLREHPDLQDVLD